MVDISQPFVIDNAPSERFPGRVRASRTGALQVNDLHVDSLKPEEELG